MMWKPSPFRQAESTGSQMTNSQIFTVGGIAFPGDSHITLGDRHPTTVGAIRLSVEQSDGVITEADVTSGFGHRAAEKLFEVRDYRSLIMLADRHDWLSAFSGELVVTVTVENAMRLPTPVRAVLERTLLAEVARIHSHLSFLSYLTELDLTDRLWQCVDALRERMLTWAGNRIHPMLNRVGGLSIDLPDDWPAAIRVTLDDIARLADALRGLLAGTDRFSGLAILNRETCLAYGLSGPVARAAGLDLDCRAEGYLAYDQVFTPVPLRDAGDAASRFAVLIDEVDASSAMIRRLLELIAETQGEVATRLSRRLKVAEGEHVSDIEAPWGIASCRLVSRGGQTPWRVALRTPSFSNLSALGTALEGHRVEQLADVIASLGYTIGDADK